MTQFVHMYKYGQVRLCNVIALQSIITITIQFTRLQLFSSYRTVKRKTIIIHVPFFVVYHHQFYSYRTYETHQFRLYTCYVLVLFGRYPTRLQCPLHTSHQVIALHYFNSKYILFNSVFFMAKIINIVSYRCWFSHVHILLLEKNWKENSRKHRTSQQVRIIAKSLKNVRLQ